MSYAQAAVFEGHPGQLVLKSIPLPLLRDDEILVRVSGCTLCGSDLHSIDGRRAVPVPSVLGHEIVGEIADFGRLASRMDLSGQPIQVGDRVTWAIVAHCGSCFFCQRGLPQKCLRGVKYGHEAMRPGLELRGGLAEYCLLAPGTSVIKLNRDVPLEVTCPASCATATIAAALDAIGDELQSRNVCVFGAGMLGLTACAMLRCRGASEVVCVDPVAMRRELATSFGATQAIAPEQLSSRDHAAEAPLNRGSSTPAPIISNLVPFGFDAVIELSGSVAAIEAAIPLLRIGGTLVLVGSVFPTPAVPVLPEQIVRRQLTLKGVHNYAPRHLLQAVEFLATNHQRYPFASLVSQWLPLAAVPEHFAAGALKNSIRVGVKLG